MRIKVNDGTLSLWDATDDVPHAEWDNRVNEYRIQDYRYRVLLEWADVWTEQNEHSRHMIDRPRYGAAAVQSDHLAPGEPMDTVTTNSSGMATATPTGTNITVTFKRDDNLLVSVSSKQCIRH